MACFIKTICELLRIHDLRRHNGRPHRRWPSAETEEVEGIFPLLDGKAHFSLDHFSLGSEVKWKNDRGETYLTGTVTTLDRESCLVLELDDVSWTRSAAPGEVTYTLAIMQDGDRTRVEFRLGDLAIDPKGREWRQSYVDSRELEKIKELAEASGSRK